MASEVPGPGADAPGSSHVAAAAAHAWAIAAAHAAIAVPAADAEAAAWIVRGWADIAVGCLALDGALGPLNPRGAVGPLDPDGAFAPLDPRGAVGPVDPRGAFGGLDEVIRARPVASGGPHAARLRELRQLAGPVPPWYPDARPVAGPIRAVGRRAWQAAGLLARFGRELMAVGADLPWSASCPLSSDRQLAWGARYRPSPSDAHRTVRLPVNRRLARRTWMCLPGPAGPGTAVAEVPSAASPLAQQIWRGIHDGAHLDHLGVLTALRPAAPSPAEFGAGLLVAESYAMAVEIVAAVECIQAGEGHAVWQLGAGLIERGARLPGGSDPAPEFTDLPTLAEVYVQGPLDVLAAGATARGLPTEIADPLHARWRAACGSYPPAAALGDAAADLAAQATRRYLLT